MVRSVHRATDVERKIMIYYIRGSHFWSKPFQIDLSTNYKSFSYLYFSNGPLKPVLLASFLLSVPIIVIPRNV